MASMDEIFGRDNFRNEILVKRIRKNVNEYETAKKLNVATDMILFYAKSDAHRIAPPMKKEKKDERWHAFDAPGLRTGMDYPLFGRKPPPGRHWMWDKDRAKEAVDRGDIRPNPRTGRPEYRVPASDETLLTTMWDDVSAYSFKYSYPTEKSEALLERIISMSGKPGGLVADFFCGSGTTLAIAERNGMRWIGCDLGRFAVHTTRKRLMEFENCRPFEILNLGKYERQIWQESSFQKGKETVLYDYLAFILRLYGAEPIAGFQQIHGKKGKVLIHIGAVDAPVTIDEVSASMAECLAAKQAELHVLGWEWEMGIHDLIEKHAKQAGIKLRLLTIPNEVMESTAVQKGDITFFDLAYIKADMHKIGKAVQIELQDFVIPNTELIPDEIRNKVSRWSDFIDYWAIDFDFQNDTFMNNWTAYRTKENTKLTIKSEPYTYRQHGRHKIIVKVIDIFGIDTSQAFEVEV
jgi:adenine-specific DNA-methyltransferase